MDNPEERDQFARIELLTKLQRDREIVAMYEENLTELRKKIEQEVHILGKLDERLGGDSL
ncbi:MAG: hypothetical protein ACRDT2_04540 [Natronosporangium sp.]